MTTFMGTAVRKVGDYGRNHATDLLGTVRAYLECGMNATDTIRRLYLSRTTFLYRLNRFVTISGLSLSDPRTRTYLSL